MSGEDSTVSYLPGTLSRLSRMQQVEALGGIFKRGDFLAAMILARGPIRLNADEMKLGCDRGKDLALRYIPAERVWETYLKGDI